MQGEFINRQAMFHGSLDTLNRAEHKAVWDGQDPVIFGVKVGVAAQGLAGLDTFCRERASDITGVAADKAREEKEAVALAYPIARALVHWFRDHDDLTNAAKVDVSQRSLRALRDAEEVSRLREIHDLGKTVAEGAQATSAVQYGITPTVVTALHKEVEEFAVAVNAPQTSIAQRAALTKQLRQRFNAVEEKFDALDDLILGFNSTPAGRAMIAAYQSARIVRDAGGGHKPAPAPPTP